MDAVTAGLGIFAQFVNWEVVAAVIMIIEMAKVYIPDNIESKLLPPIAVLVGGLLSLIPALHINLIIGLVSGFAATAGYQTGLVGVEKIVKTVQLAINHPEKEIKPIEPTAPATDIQPPA